MTTMTADELGKKAGTVRRTLVSGDEVLVTFHGKPWARVVLENRIEDDRSELDQLRAEVEELRSQLEGYQ